MKLLFVVNVDWFFVSHRLPIALMAIDKGYEVHLASKNTEHFSYLRSLGIHTHELDFSRSGINILSELRTVHSLRKLITTIEPNVIHSVTIKPVLYTGLVSHFVNVTAAKVFAVSGLGYVFSSKTLKAKLIRLVVSALYKVAFYHDKKRVIFQNSVDERVVRELVNLADNEIVRIKGSGVDLNQYTYTPEPESNVTKVVMAARLLREKGVLEFISAAKLVHEIRSDIQFTLAGPLDIENPNAVGETELKDLLADGVVRYIGPCDNVSKLFSESHIVALPSYYGEGLPKVLIEAAACGRAVITTNNPGCRDAIEPDNTGVLIPAKDVGALVNAVVTLADDKSLRQKMGILGRAFAEREFDVNAVVDKHLEVYEVLLQS